MRALHPFTSHWALRFSTTIRHAFLDELAHGKALNESNGSTDSTFHGITAPVAEMAETTLEPRYSRHAGRRQSGIMAQLPDPIMGMSSTRTSGGGAARALRPGGARGLGGLPVHLRRDASGG
ncbi:hypothetical protein [Streptomyces sp. NPDC018972]|uniref:hypothetical protein n=1 Tax=Streptomyces sp. NPDC018972 TaxID=3365060 RepID=UPI0037B223A9